MHPETGDGGAGAQFFKTSHPGAQDPRMRAVHLISWASHLRAPRSACLCVDFFGPSLGQRTPPTPSHPSQHVGSKQGSSYAKAAAKAALASWHAGAVLATAIQSLSIAPSTESSGKRGLRAVAWTGRWQQPSSTGALPSPCSLLPHLSISYCHLSCHLAGCLSA